MNLVPPWLLLLLFFVVLVFPLIITAWTLPNPRHHTKNNNNNNNINNGPQGLAYPQQTPHAGRHFTPLHHRRRRTLLLRKRQRFMEGWYYRLTLDDDDNVSFAIIVSIENDLACIQMIGPDDTYIVQADREAAKFWAWKDQPGLGCTFTTNINTNTSITNSTNNNTGNNCIPPTVQSTLDWYQKVETGFQILPEHCLGKIKGSRGVLPDGDDNLGSCHFDFKITPLQGWGTRQSTGGWLSRFAVFEPHWQVLLADALATGHVTWNGTRYEFHNAKFYAEKNWGIALPSKWYWTQCNQFDNYANLSVTAGGGIRKIPFGRQEALGMIGVTYQGILYQAVPWTGHMEWKVSPWGSWILKGNSTTPIPFAVQVEYTTTAKGLVFRAPTPDQGMVYNCRDTFTANVTLTLWNEHGVKIIDGATSRQGGAEVGGGPWWTTWQATSVLKQPIKALLIWPTKLSNPFRRRSKDDNTNKKNR